MCYTSDTRFIDDNLHESIPFQEELSLNWKAGGPWKHLKYISGRQHFDATATSATCAQGVRMTRLCLHEGLLQRERPETT